MPCDVSRSDPCWKCWSSSPSPGKKYICSCSQSKSCDINSGGQSVNTCNSSPASSTCSRPTLLFSTLLNPPTSCHLFPPRPPISESRCQTTVQLVTIDNLVPTSRSLRYLIPCPCCFRHLSSTRHLPSAPNSFLHLPHPSCVYQAHCRNTYSQPRGS
ncbi:uncharacterized protein CCOS01_08646 [Colletotrichum costaricense]|uniref:Uncharacterized protein n=1 Tax=Colletotrichum costaricense TaxID=1209916 RepID=A0AAI9YWA2_9PEZI|nr:uncharacterized protein CCOS01_08646 [Colletotrichum costaricense]KAK1526228.1 hypothetical protein CCOS01_08646 [Colletotrichum costaricense]